MIEAVEAVERIEAINPVIMSILFYSLYPFYPSLLMPFFNVINLFQVMLFLADSKKKRIFVRFKGYPF